MSERKAVERRRHDRVKKRCVVRFGHGDLAHNGYSQDVSESGIYLQTSVIYPPHTVLTLQIEYPEKTVTVRGVVRWSKELPPAFRRSLRGGMGLEFLRPAAPVASSVAHAEAPPDPQRTVPKGPPAKATETELGGGVTRHRQVSTRGGNTYEVIQAEYRGAIYIRLFQLPRTEGSAEAVFREAFWTRDEAETAVKAFLREH